ncbi:MAG: class I SAM-dependent methyltransferase [Myxococcota bacterium]|nr:class I SAM-dependent methyltransferase [Myxococcota bacterium]
MSNANEPETYAGKSLYDAVFASKYNRQYTEGLSLSNFRAKFVAVWEERAFRALLAEVPGGQQVLDIACGTGRYLQIHVESGNHPTGMDISPHMLEHARKNVGPDVPLLLGDAEKLPFEDHSFDGVTCMRLYQRVPSAIRVRMLREVRRVSRGWAIVYFGGTTPWLNVRRNLRSSVFGLKHNGQYRATLPQILMELREAGVYVVDFQWVMSLMTDGILFHVQW